MKCDNDRREQGRYDEKMSKNIAIQRADSTIVTTTCDSMEIVNAQQCEMRKKKSHCHKTKLKSQYGFILALSLSHSCSQCCKIRRLYSLPRLFHRLIRITHKYKQKCGIDAMILIQIDKIGEGLFRRH